MIYVTCKKCGRKIKIQRKATYEKHKNDEFECIICNSNQNGYVCKECGEIIVTSKGPSDVRCYKCHPKHEFVSNKEKTLRI